MTTSLFSLAIGLTLVAASIAGAQHPLLDMAAEHVVQKYKGSTCEQS